MVAKRLNLGNGYSFFILHRGKRWFANRVYPNIPQVQSAMIEIMKSGNLAASPFLAIGSDVVYKSAEVF
jgi:hypothetical protein